MRKDDATIGQTIRDQGFLNFLEREAKAVTSQATVGSGRGGLATAVVDGLAMESCSLALCSDAVGVDTFAIADGFTAKAECSIGSYSAEPSIGIVPGWLRSRDCPQWLHAAARRIGFVDADALDAAYPTTLGATCASYRAERSA